MEGPDDNENVGDRLPVTDGDQRAIQAGRSEADGGRTRIVSSWFVVFCLIH